MNVSGVTPSSGIYAYNSIRLNELRSQQIVASQEHRDREVKISAPSAEEEAVRQETIRQNQTYTSYEYAQEFKPGEVYEMKGPDADINQLDVTKAVSDMEKDQILQQYQYFVGDALHIASQNQDAALRSGENFIL